MNDVMGPKCARTVPLLVPRQPAVQRLHGTHTYRLLTRERSLPTRQTFAEACAARVSAVVRLLHRGVLEIAAAATVAADAARIVPTAAVGAAAAVMAARRSFRTQSAVERVPAGGALKIADAAEAAAVATMAAGGSAPVATPKTTAGGCNPADRGLSSSNGTDQHWSTHRGHRSTHLEHQT